MRTRHSTRATATTTATASRVDSRSLLGTRARAMARIAAQLHEQGHLREGVSAEEADDVLWVITSFESFDLLYSGRGLPLDAVVERLTATAERALMTP